LAREIKKILAREIKKIPVQSRNNKKQTYIVNNLVIEKKNINTEYCGVLIITDF